jgi:large subunit ribosomal protein L10
MKDNADLYTFKTGVVDGRLIDLTQLTTIANLPSKEELISKLLFVLNAQAQRIVTVINAVPRDLAVVIKQIGDKAPAGAAPAAEAKTEEAAPAAEEAKAEEPAPAAIEEAAPAAAEEAPTAATEEAAPAAEAEAAPPAEETPAAE